MKSLLIYFAQRRFYVDSNQLQVKNASESTWITIEMQNAIVPDVPLAFSPPSRKRISFKILANIKQAFYLKLSIGVFIFL